MIRRLYIHNFRCLENFELPISGQPSVLLVGKNGSGKTSVGLALEVLQNIARGTNQVGALVRPKDLSRGRTDVPMRFEIEVELKGNIYGYTLALDFPKGFKQLRVFEEAISVNSRPIYTREMGKVHLSAGLDRQKEAAFVIDWHLVALPIIQHQSEDDPIGVLTRWLAQMLILRPIPALMSGLSDSETLVPGTQLKDFGNWFSGLLAHAPSAYSTIDEYLKNVMPDLKDIRNPSVGPDARRLEIQFSNEQGALILPFEDLSDGEKCFMICALVLASNRAYGPAFCFWDEPDNYLAISEVGHFALTLRRAFQSGGQFIATSHNAETIRRFSAENTLVLSRRSHLEPTIVQKLSEMQFTGDFVDALTRDDV